MSDVLKPQGRESGVQPAPRLRPSIHTLCAMCETGAHVGCNRMYETSGSLCCPPPRSTMPALHTAAHHCTQLHHTKQHSNNPKSRHQRTHPRPPTQHIGHAHKTIHDSSHDIVIRTSERMAIPGTLWNRNHRLGTICCGDCAASHPGDAGGSGGGEERRRVAVYAAAGAAEGGRSMWTKKPIETTT